MVHTLIDHRNDAKMFKNWQWNHSLADRGFTWVPTMKIFFDLYKGRDKRTHFFRKAKKNSSKRFSSVGARIQLSSCWLVPGQPPSMLEVLSSIPIYDFRSLFDFCPLCVGIEIPVKLNVALVERERGVGGGIKWVQRRPTVFSSDDDYSEQLT